MRKALILGLLLTTQAFSENLGVYGHTYPISEQDLLIFIESSLKARAHDGSLETVQKQWAKSVKHAMIHPKPLDLSATEEGRTWIYDPTFTLKKDLKDSLGNIIFYKGMSVNPLKALPSFNETLLFFDAEDPKQVQWARSKIARIKAQNADPSKHNDIKLILTGGNLKKTSKALNARVYFDQEGRITHKLDIKHVPVSVVRENDALKVREYAVKEYADE